jgi:hypothetical protein
VKKEEIIFLRQMIDSLEDAGRRLEREYRRKNNHQANKIIKAMMQIQGEIAEIINKN